MNDVKYFEDLVYTTHCAAVRGGHGPIIWWAKVRDFWL